MADWYVSSVAWAAIPQFAASTAYTVGQIVRSLTTPAFNQQFAFRCTTAGTSGAEPTWPAINNATVTTGGATFANVSGQSAYGWSAAAGNFWEMTYQNANQRVNVGDRAFLSSDHVETSASQFYGGGPGGFGGIAVISVNRTGSVPPVAADALSGATIIYNGGSSLNIDPLTNQYWEGITFNLGGTATNFYLCFNGTKSNYFKNCAFVFSTSITNATMSTDNPTRVVMENTTVQFNNVAQRFFAAYPCELIWMGGSILGTAPTVLFNGSNNQCMFIVVCRGVDLSAVTNTLVYDAAVNNAFMKVLFDSCRIATGVARLGTATYNSAGDEVELVNCYDGTRFVSERHTPAGDVTADLVTTMVGGSRDDVGLFSHKMISSSRSDPWSMTLDGFWLDVENTNVGASHTATVELIASAALNNNDIRLVLEYQGTSGSSLATFSSISALTPTAALPTSTGITWNSPPSTPVMQHLSVTFTQRTAGRLRACVRLGKPSTTVWYNPQIALT